MTNNEFIALLNAQLDCTTECIESFTDFMGSGDRYDYLSSALALSSELMSILDSDEEDREKQLIRLMPFHNNYACDGVANELDDWETPERLRNHSELPPAEIEEYITNCKT